MSPLFSRTRKEPDEAERDRFECLVRDLVEHRDFREAERQVRRWMRKYPKDKESACNAAIQISQAGAHRVAAELLISLRKRTGPDWIVSVNIAAAYLLEDLAAAALDHAEEAAALCDDHAHPHRILGETLLKLDALDEAKDALVRALQIEPENQDSLLKLGRVDFELGNYTEAIEIHRRCVENDPSSFQCLSNLAACLIGSGHLQEAEKVILSALTIAPNDGISICNLALICERQGMPHDALALYQRAAAADPEYTRASDEAKRLAAEIGS